MSPPPLLTARALVRVYRRRGGEVRAVDGVDLEVEGGAVTALIGRSGSGKSTLARCLALLEHPDAGEIRLDGVDVATLDGATLSAARRSLQLVVQDPVRAVNPRFTLLEAVGEPLAIAGVAPGARRERVRELLDEVELDAADLDRLARALSGGQIQRLVLARALACEPRALILDEAMSGLDLPSRARLRTLLTALRRRHGLTYVIATHDQAAVADLADRVYELRAGRVVGVAERLTES